MPDIPQGAKSPSDRKAKKSKDAPDRFSFEHDGETYTFKPTYDVLTPGFLRANRRRSEIDAFFTMVEGLIDDYDKKSDKSATLDVIDNMSRDEFKAVMGDFYDYLEVSQGE